MRDKPIQDHHASQCEGLLGGIPLDALHASFYALILPKSTGKRRAAPQTVAGCFLASPVVAAQVRCALAPRRSRPGANYTGSRNNHTRV